MSSWIEIRPIPGELSGAALRKAEGEMWRKVVRERLGPGVSISYNENGAPVLSEGFGYIGVSHTKGWVAVIWSPSPCAIDIEPKVRKISPAVAARMGIEAEIGEWCAWEARYKYRGLTGTEPANDYDYDQPEVRFLPHPELVVAIITSTL